MASLILNDTDAASEIVVDTIVDASRRKHTLDSDDGRVRAALAASVYWRCVGAIVLYERLPRRPAFEPSLTLPRCPLPVWACVTASRWR